MSHELPSRNSLITGIAPEAKIIAFLGVVILAATLPGGAWRQLAAYALLVVSLIIYAGLSPSYLFKRLGIALVFVLFIGIFLPFFGSKAEGFIFIGGLKLSRAGLILLATSAAKVCIAVSALALLSGTTQFEKLFAGFARLRFPKLLLTQINLTHSYLFLLREEFSRMIRARDSRGYKGGWLWHAGSFGHLAGALFLRTTDRGERIYMAMLSRGYSANTLHNEKTDFNRNDFLFAVIMLALSTAIRIFLQG